MCAAAAEAQATPISHGTLELIARNPWIAPGQTLDLGLRFQLDKGWHIYWVNPGDSGEPPRIEWQLPAGLTAGPIEWPAPRRFESGTIVDYGYEDAVLLIVPLQAEASLPTQQPVRIGADVKLLVCSHEMCVPGKAELSLTLPIKSPPMLNVHNNVVRKQDVENEHLFAATSQSLPRPAPGNWKFSVADVNDSFVLSVNLGRETAGREFTQAIFFPLAESQIENAAPQRLQPSATGFRLTLRTSDRLLKPIARLQGVLVFAADHPDSTHPDSNQSYIIDVPISKSGAPKTSSIKIHPAEASQP
ncbi:MAG: protein-disulfide reductase DsbD domain-containing protein [Terriglobales bacterium]